MTPYDFQRALRVAMLCSSKDVMRAQLCGVNVTSDFLEATDGHRLVRVRFPGKVKNTGFATRLEAKVYLKRLALQPGLYDEGFTGPTVAQLPLVTNPAYPDTSHLWDWARAAPQSGDVWFNPRYLATLHRIAKALSPAQVHSVALSLGGPLEPALFRVNHEELRVELLLMPMKKPNSEMAPGFECGACSHHHQSEQFGHICIGCPCPERLPKPTVICLAPPTEASRG